MSEFPNITFSTFKGKRRGTLVVYTNDAATAGIDFKGAGSSGQMKTVNISGKDISEGVWMQNWDAYTLKLSVKGKQHAYEFVMRR